MRHFTLSALTCGALVYRLSLAHAQQPEPSPAPEATPPAAEAPAAPADPSAPPAAAPGSERPRMTPPQLVQAVEPVYPEAQRQSGQAASVGLVLTLDTEGNVTDASVNESAGPDFDAAALEAAPRLKFSPALAGDTPVAAKIPFRFEFKLAAPPPPPVVVAPVAPAPEPVAAPEPEGSLDIEVEGEKPPREPTRRALAAEEITKIPGTNGDALRSVLNMPGIAQPGAFEGLLVVRGSSPNDSLIFIDSMNVPIVYHFGGLSSVVPSEMLERIDFYPGNFGPQYGRASGGIIDVGVRGPRKEGYGGLLQFDLIDGRILAEGAINESTRVMIGGRRSWVDAWLGPVLDSAGSSVRTAPVYYDAQAMIEHDVSRDTTLRLFAYGSDDRLALLVESPDPGDPASGGDISLHTGFWRVQGRADTRLSANTRWTTTVGVGKDFQDFGIGNNQFAFDIKVLDARTDLRAQLIPELTLVTGLDIQTGSFDVSSFLPPIDFENDDTSGPLFGRPPVELTADGNLFRPSAYAMAELAPFNGLKVMPGVRVDYIHDAKEWTADPRVAFRYDLYPSALRTTIKGGVGLFHKAPEPYETIEPFGSPDVNSERAMHYSLGFEQELSKPLEISVEGFYKDLDQLAVQVPDSSRQSGVRYQNSGVGRTMGAEFLLRYKPVGRFFGWVAYTLSKSERRDNPADEYSLFDYDQTHILTALGSYKLGRGWQLGARFRYITGRPYTPFVGGIVDYDAGAYAPVESLAQNSSRYPARHQLDVRVDKTWEFQSWKLSTYLDVQNVYNRENTEEVGYNYDYSQVKGVPGLPILPIIGIRGEL
jgi:TonB family protein